MPSTAASELSTTPTTSVVICAYTDRRWGDIEAALQALTLQSPPPEQILLVIDHNDDLLARARAELLPAHPGLRIVANTRENGLSGARNTAIELCTSEVLAFLDDDATPDKHWLAELVAPFADPAVIAVGGRAEPRWPVARPAWFPTEFDWVVGCSYRGLPTATAPVRNVIGCSMAFRAEAFTRVGNFVEGIGRVGTLPLGCEETELCIRLGQDDPKAVIVYAPASLVSHRVSDDRTRLRYFLSRCWSEGLSKAQIAALVGNADSTSSERSYAVKTLPLGVLRGIGDLVRLDVTGLGRAASIVVGLAVTTAGFVVGSRRRVGTD